ncbi:Sensor histidine kinase ResE [Fundidesulfovibrio magnetotacticus]|uniref:histidine kinase n=1 Tax=Fundidesulfovibrio magnetotacticus TaxID=2730080 RepID=A0A6V8LQJ6_9BACT|nr:HAMP domain-containing sensor histidine kinase [Fundidesulfovibrio magnetotacticus]GFK92831.1 Sensor histidine kinase ResE [Fundidesulfovibrio magnetotacticus]
MIGFGARIFLSHLAACCVALLTLAAAPPGAAGAGLAVGAGLAASALLGWLAARRHARFVRQCAAVLQAVGDGDHGRRLWPEPGQALEELAQGVNAMADGIEGQIRALEAEKLRMETILDGMREGLMVLGADGRILLANKALEALFPQAAGAVGKRPIEVLACPELQTAADTVLHWKDPERPAVVSVQIEPGQERFLDVSLVRPSPPQAGLGAVLVFHDLTEFKRLDKVRRDFVANVSHELRTPLTSIKGYAETLMAEKPFREGQPRRFLDVILKNANHMSRMVDELLGLARIENDRQPAVKSPVRASDCLRAALRECAALSAERRVAVESLLPPDGPVVLADAGRLTQVLRNLVENALKYGPEGSAVTVSHHPGDTGVIFRVEDDGPGVPEAERLRVFERFYRVDRPRNKGEGGTGLGLAIAKHIVERHGGRIWAEQARPPRTGAAFCFSLPEAP